MEYLIWLVDLCLHIDRHLGVVIAAHGNLAYGLLFLIVFLETGIVVTPFLPGDSLIFAAGSFAGLGVLDGWTLVGVLTTAAVLGDAVSDPSPAKRREASLGVPTAFVRQVHGAEPGAQPGLVRALEEGRSLRHAHG